MSLNFGFVFHQESDFQKKREIEANKSFDEFENAGDETLKRKLVMVIEKG